jgi:hypothetical protein
MGETRADQDWGPTPFPRRESPFRKAATTTTTTTTNSAFGEVGFVGDDEDGA